MAAQARKVALVTAGSAGLGAAIARVLALDLGMSVTINYNSNADRAEALVQDLQDAWATRQAAGTKQAPSPVFHAIRADISQRSEIVRLVEETTAASGGFLDVVVSNVGWTRMRDFSNLEDGVEEEDWDRCFGSNVKAHLWLFHAAKKWLEESNARDEGSAVFVSTASIAGCKPSGSSLVWDPKLSLLAGPVNSNWNKLGVVALRRHKGGANPPHQIPSRHSSTDNKSELRLAWGSVNSMSSPGQVNLRDC